MSPRQRESSPRAEEQWDWLAVALFLLVPVDLLTTFGAAARVGVGAEANPLVASLLQAPLWVVVGVNLGVIVASVVGFAVLVRLRRRTTPALKRPFRVTIDAWLGLLVAAGLFVFANNFSVIVHGLSLLS